MELKKVFISYSRFDLDAVKAIKSVIEEECGVKCWMDLKDIEPGSPQFTKEIIAGIDNCDVFLFMLSEKSQESEYALLELKYAEDEGKRVVLVNINNCKLSKTFKFYYKLTDRIAWTHQDQREKLLTGIKKWVHPTEETKTVAFLKIKTDLDCAFYLDGEETAKLKAGDRRSKFPLPEGEYELKFVSAENNRDIVRDDNFKMPPFDKLYDVKLLPIRDKRREQERIAEVQKAREDVAKEEKRQGCRRVADGLVFNVKGVEFKLVNVEGGPFSMGSIDDRTYGDERPVHDVTLSSFYMGETVVTQALWKAVMGVRVSLQRVKVDAPWPLRGEGNEFPIYYVSYDEIVNEFLPKLNRLTRKSFRLPTEAEWEYAARGGKMGKGYKYAGSDTIGDVAWYRENSGGETHVVKTRSPNELGLYDMSGNVWEWCQDWYGAYDSISQTDPVGPSDALNRVLRGGSWHDRTWLCWVSYRHFNAPGYRDRNVGFRLVLPQ